MQIHWVQIWGSNNFPLSSPCPQVCKNWLPTPARAGSNKHFLHTQCSSHCSLSSTHMSFQNLPYYLHWVSNCLWNVWGHSSIIRPRTTSYAALFESHCLCFAVLVGFYLQFTMVFLLMGPSNTLLSILLTMAISTSSDLIIYHLGWSWSLWIKCAYLVHISVPSHFDNYRIACLAIFNFK